MVNADHVKELSRALHPANPPAKAIRFHAVIVIQGVAPQLAVLGEVVRRHAGDLRGYVALAQLEEMGLRPHIGGIHRHIDRQVADDLQPLGVDIVPQGVPLLEE